MIVCKKACKRVEKFRKKIRIYNEGEQNGYYHAGYLAFL